ncbi:hypothetical protein I4J33_03345 [Corynebacterium belfantii]|nr:hypothetical protein [Corynebacterium belfantii]
MALRRVGRFSQPWLGWDWLALVGVGGRWWVLVGAPPPLTPEKDGTSHQIRPNGRFSCDLV